jgi:hypothetical protein
MNASEGLIRIAKVIRVIGILIALGCVSFALTEPNSFGFFIFFGALPLAISFAIAWVIDGFAKK